MNAHYRQSESHDVAMSLYHLSIVMCTECRILSVEGWYHPADTMMSTSCVFILQNPFEQAWVVRYIIHDKDRFTLVKMFTVIQMFPFISEYWQKEENAQFKGRGWQEMMWWQEIMRRMNNNTTKLKRIWMSLWHCMHIFIITYIWADLRKGTISRRLTIMS